MQLIKITKKGNVKSIEKTNIDFINKNKNISKLNTWDYNNCKLILYGCVNGDAGEENKYDLPPPCDCDLFFNDLYFVKYKNNIIKDLSLQEYNMFYVKCFEGFESIDSTEDEVEEELSEHTSDREFINDDDISICSGTNDLDISELSDFTSEENKKTTTEENDNNSMHNDENNDEISSIEITISSCSDVEEFDDLENDIDTE